MAALLEALIEDPSMFPSGFDPKIALYKVFLRIWNAVGTNSFPNFSEEGNFEIPVIFITGHPERLLTGQKPEPTFLIPKPFDARTVKAIIGQALFFEVVSRSKAAIAAAKVHTEAHLARPA